MNTPAIHQAIRLKNHPEEMAWLRYPESDLPDGMTDLLRLANSKSQIASFAKTNEIDQQTLCDSLHEFISQVLLNEKNSPAKIVGTDNLSSIQQQEQHYQLLQEYLQKNVKGKALSQNLDRIDSAINTLKTNNSENIRFSQQRKVSRELGRPPSQAHNSLSLTNTVIAVLAAVSIFSLVALAGQLYDPAKPKYIASQQQSQPVETSPEKQTTKNWIQISSASLTTPENNVSTNGLKSVPDQALQHLLKGLETAYENGDVAKIQPILATVPEISGQTSKQLHDKLETLFDITTARKMLLFDFNWNSVNNTLQGKGQFVSRYRLVGEQKWLSRQGNATVTVALKNNTLRVTQLLMENQGVD